MDDCVSLTTDLASVLAYVIVLLGIHHSTAAIIDLQLVVWALCVGAILCAHSELRVVFVVVGCVKAIVAVMSAFVFVRCR